MSAAMHTKGESTDLLQLVSFKIGNEEFGVDILDRKSTRLNSSH